MGSQPSNPPGDGNQNSSLRSVVSSVRRTIDWDHSTRVFGSPTVLDSNGSGGKAGRNIRYYNAHRTHAGLRGRLPNSRPGNPSAWLHIGGRNIVAGSTKRP